MSRRTAKNWWEWLWPNRCAIALPIFLAACGPDAFYSIAPAQIEEAGGSDSATIEEAGVDAIEEWTTDGPHNEASSSDAGVDAPMWPCGDPNDVVHGGKCFYLDGTAGACVVQGYTLSSDAAMASILQANPSAFKGKGFRTKTSYNCCVFTASSPRNYGMVSNCNTSPFAANEPAFGGTACNTITGAAKTDQLTLCERLAPQ